MFDSIWAKLIIVLAIIGLLKWGHHQVYQQGYNAHKAEVADLKDEADEEGKADVKTVIKWRTETKVEYRDKIKYIKLAQDPTGCADTKLSDMGFRLH